MTPKTIFRRISNALLGEPTVRLQRMIFHEATRAFRLDQPDFPPVLRLPAAYGRRLPERVVELLLARCTYVPGAKVLDVGHSNIMECHRRLLSTLALPRHLTGIDIATPTYDTSLYYERSIIADITATGLPANGFDIIWCISTMEHIGLDNSGYTTNFKSGTGLDVLAIREMFRILAPGGKFLITVPFGIYEDHGWFRNYDTASWQHLLASIRTEATIYELYFAYDPTLGWRMVESSRLASTQYGSFPNAGAAGLAAALIEKEHPHSAGRMKR